MEFSFVIPRNNKDLLDADVSGYYVKQVYNPNELSQHIRAAQQALQSSDAFYIFDHFDAFFSVIENAQQMQMQHLYRTIDVLYKTTEDLGQKLDEYLKQETLDRQHDFLNLLKMVIYLLVTTVRVIDEFVKNNTSQNASTGRKKSKQSYNDDQAIHYTSYEKKRKDVLVQICNIMELPIEKLFPNSIPEEDFVNKMCDLAYRTLSHPSIKDDGTVQIVFQILGKAIKNYNHAMSFPVQIVQILEREEIAVIPIARGVGYLYDELSITTVLNILIKEFIDQLNVNMPSATTSKHFSMFLTEIGEHSSELALLCLQNSEEILNLEPYAIRNALFGISCGVLIGQLSGENLDEEQKEVRDELLEDLYNHIEDTNSYVRSKVLQLWNELQNRHAIPLNNLLKVVCAAVERLEDRTATVRKNAVTLLKSILESNPFASKLTLEELEKKYEEESRKAAIIREQAQRQEEDRPEVEADFVTRCLPQLTPILDRILSGNPKDGERLANGVMSLESTERIELIRSCLRDGEYERVCQAIIQLDAPNVAKRMEMTLEQQIFYFVYVLKTYLFDDYNLEQINNVVGFLEDSIEFSKHISLAVPKLERMLMSTTMTDVLEVIEFFKTGYLFKIKGCESGMKMMLRLLYISTGHQEKNEKGEAVIRAYHAVLFQTDTTGRARHLKVVENLCYFLSKISNDEYTAFGIMIKHWIDSNDIDIGIINVMFERFTMKLSDTTPANARCCMELLILVSNAKPAVAKSNVKLITDILGSRRIMEDPRIFAGCLKLLMSSHGDKNDKATKGYAFVKRYDDTAVIEGVIHNLKRFFFYPKLAHFEAITSEAINFLYRMCDQPDTICQDIIHAIVSKVNEISEKKRLRTMDVIENGIASSQVTEMYIPEYLLPRIIFIFGYIASKELVYLDIDVYSNMKHLEDLKREKKEKANSTNKRKSKSSLNVSASEALKRKSTANNTAHEAQEQDEAYMGATAEDSIAELISNICENELVSSDKGFLYHFIPVLLEILSQPGRYANEKVQRAAVLTLMRFMVVSGKFCEEKISFLMNIMKRSTNPSMKCNIIIGLADLTCRFANTIEPWIPNFYAMLLESDETVRLTTVKMLSYVILQAIVRVTGQLADMAACIVDTNMEIQNVTREFFHQLVASKEAEYYKILPDIISRLSSDTPIEETKFQIIMKYLLELIQKNTQVEGLVEKLCVRFRNTNTERQWRDVAYCLSLLNHTEKSMRKLIENVNCYKDKVQIDEIYNCFKTIVTNANKQITKVEIKNMAKELDVKLQECLKVDGEEESETGGDVSVNGSSEDAEGNSAGRAAPPPNKKQKKPDRNQKGTQKNRRGRPAVQSSDDDDDDEAIENSPPKKGRNGPQPRNGRGRRRVQTSESEDSSDDEPVKGRKGTRR